MIVYDLYISRSGRLLLGSTSKMTRPTSSERRYLAPRAARYPSTKSATSRPRCAKLCVSQDCNETVGTLLLAEMIKEKIPELQRLSPAEKFALAIELWDELSSNPDEIPVTEEQLNEMDRRFEEYQRDPDKVVSWEEVKARILSTRP